MDDPPRRSLEVEPAAVARRGGWTVPALVAVLAVAFVGVALAKPWGGEAEATARPAPTAGAGSPLPVSTGQGPSAGPPATPSVIRVRDEDLLAAASPHSAWGVRAVVLPSDPVLWLTERWTPIDDPGYRTAPDTRTVAASAPVGAEGDAVVALAVTTPADALPLAVRVWRMDTGGIPRRVPVASVAGPDPGSRLWRPVTSSGVPGAPWPPGTYRLDTLLGRSILRVVVVVSGTPARDDADSPPTTLPSDLGQALTTLGEGLVVVADGRPLPVDALAAPEARLGEREAWLSPGLDLPSWAVGRVTSATVAGVGIVMPPGAVPTSLVLDLVSPVDAGVVAPTLEVVAGGGTGRAAIIAHADGGRPFAAGTYRVWATWRPPGGGAGTSVRYLEIVPPGMTGPEPAAPLDTLRAWARLAPAGPPAGTPIVTDADLLPNRSRGTCGGGAIITASTPLLGLLLPDPERVVDIRLSRGPGVTRVDTRAMLPLDDGLALLALPEGGLEAGTYRVDVVREVGRATGAPAADTRSTAYDICIR